MTRQSLAATRLIRVQELARAQALTISAKQCHEIGFSRDRILRLLRQDVWQRIFPGVYFTANAPPPLTSRLRAALLYAGPSAAISHQSAGFLHGILRQHPAAIWLVIPQESRIRAQKQLHIQRRRVMPRVLSEQRVVAPAETVVDLLDVNIRKDTALGYVTNAIRKNVPPQAILHALAQRSRHRNRRLLQELLFDATTGIESPLEFRFDRDVEKAHGLPRSRKQVVQKVSNRWIRSDCRYDEYQLRVELDGEIAHPGGRTNSDTWRDNAVLLQATDLTLRYRWYHVAVTPCHTARQIAAALKQRGWRDEPARCSPTCRL